MPISGSIPISEVQVLSLNSVSRAGVVCAGCGSTCHGWNADLDAEIATACGFGGLGI